MLEKVADKLGDRELRNKIAARQAVSNATFSVSMPSQWAQQPQEQQRRKKPLKPETETDYYIR